MTMAEFLAPSARPSGSEEGSPDEGAWFAEEMIEPAVPVLLDDVRDRPHSFDVEQLFEETKALDWEGWRAALLQQIPVRDLVQTLMADVLHLAGHRPLMSFFVRDRFAWAAACGATGHLRAAPVIATERYGRQLVVVHLADAAPELIERAWYAELAGASGEPLALAAGMVLPFSRDSRGERASDPPPRSEDMRGQLATFRTQHHDATELAERHDWCFVRHWHRSPEAARGTGAICLARRSRRCEAISTNWASSPSTPGRPSSSTGGRNHPSCRR